MSIMHNVILRNTRHGTIEIISSPYDFERGDVVYPVSLRDKYPGYNENRHVVVIPNARAEALAEIERRMQK